MPSRPRLRPLEMVPYGGKDDLLLAVYDPEGFSETVVLPYPAAVLAALMDGTRTLAEIQADSKRRLGRSVSLARLKELILELDEAYLLETPRFCAFRRRQVERYLKAPVRPAVHAGGAYARDPEELAEQMAGCFACEKGPGSLESRSDPPVSVNGLCLGGVVSPHIDLHRGGPAFAWAYKAILEETDADLFVIFGTAHNAMRQLFSISRKDFDTPLGVVRTDKPFIERAARDLASSVAGRLIDPFEDELAHRWEHSIEFQVMFLQYVLGRRRPFAIVPVLVGSFHEFFGDGVSPQESPEVQAFVAAIRAAAKGHGGQTCYVGGADLAHIGQRFGDNERIDPRRQARQAEDDRRLLEAVCRGDSAALFQHVADQNDCNRICGLAPMYTLLEVVRPSRGRLLAYDQAVEPDGSSCVSFASVALYRESGSGG